MDAENIDDYLNGRLGHRATEKGLYGEVFTPVSVVDKMLAMLPASVWKRTDLRWCDPACGIGHFPLKAIYGGAGYPGLLTGLASSFPSRAAALRHIIENMLWCYDINSEHTAVLRGTFKKLCSGAGTGVVRMNIITGDFLTAAATEEPFDIIMGNPPYNSGGTKRVGEKRLHVRFAEVALGNLTSKGHLLFVCPPSYREAGSTMNALFRGADGGFRHIWILGPNETHRLFKVQTRVDAFLWSMGHSEETIVLDELGTESRVRLDLTRHVPNFGFSIFEKLRARSPAHIRAFRTAEATTISCEKSGFTARGRYPTLHLIVEGGRKVLRRGRPHTLQNVRKIMLNGLGIPYVYYDREGKYGVTQTPVVITDPTERLYKFMMSPLFYFIVWGLRITGNNNLPYLFQDVPEGFGEDIKWTAAERESIEKFGAPNFSDADIIVGCSSAGAESSGGRGSTRRAPRRSETL